ncbi:hypothetical protein B0J14DRAFT_102014 [Halenospora varia]|nr:hypothetical protein B0J14DRAFT_102014 [Halenospora varia]
MISICCVKNLLSQPELHSRKKTMPLPQRSSIIDFYNNDGFKENTHLQLHATNSAVSQTPLTSTRESNQELRDTHQHAVSVTYRQLTSFTTSVHHLLIFLTKMPVYITPITPLRSDRPTQPLILTPSQIAIHGTVTPDIKPVRFLKHKFPQLHSLTKEQNKKRDLGMDPLPLNWEYVVRPNRGSIGGECPCEHLIQERKTPQLPQWGRPKKQIPTTYYLEQLELARPSEFDWETLYVSDPPLEYPIFQRCVMVVWVKIVMVVSMVWNTMKLTSKTVVDALRILLTCLVVFPAQMVMEIIKSIQWDMVIVSIMAAVITKWLPGWTGEVLIEEEVEKPLYTIMIAGGRSIGTGPVLQTR